MINFGGGARIQVNLNGLGLVLGLVCLPWLDVRTVLGLYEGGGGRLSLGLGLGLEIGYG